MNLHEREINMNIFARGETVFFKFIYWLPHRCRLTLTIPLEKAKSRNRILYFTRLGIDALLHLVSGSCYCLASPQSAFLLFIKKLRSRIRRFNSFRCLAETRLPFFFSERESGISSWSLNNAVDHNYNISNLLAGKVSPRFRYPRL